MIRDTDEDWKGISGEPFYGVFPHPNWFRKRMSADDLVAFWATGRAEIAWLVKNQTEHFGAFSPKTAIDFGCGVGRLTRAIAARVEQVCGVDIAPNMLEEAGKHSFPNIEYQLTLPEQQVDWIHSSLVFQHIHPENGYPLLGALLSRLAPGGALTIQIGIWKERRVFSNDHYGADAIAWDGTTSRTLLETPPGSGTIMTYDYDVNHVLAMFYAHGIERLMCLHTNHDGYHGGYFIGRRES